LIETDSAEESLPNYRQRAEMTALFGSAMLGFIFGLLARQIGSHQYRQTLRFCQRLILVAACLDQEERDFLPVERATEAAFNKSSTTCQVNGDHIE
jgi:hypothetical protein